MIKNIHFLLKKISEKYQQENDNDISITGIKPNVLRTNSDTYY